MKLTDAEFEKRRDRIINEAFRLFSKNGIDQTTLEDVAKAAHVGLSSIYRYFTSKPFLVHATLDVLWQSIGAELEKSVNEVDAYVRQTGRQQVALWMEAFHTLYQVHADYVLFSYEAKLYLQRNDVQISEDEFDGLMAHIMPPCVAALDKGKADGSIPTDADSVDVFYAVWGCVRGYIVKIVIYDKLCKGHGPWKSRFDLVLQGILSALSHGFHVREEKSLN